MIWAVDQDDGRYDALTGLLGEEAMQGSLIQGGNLSDAQKAGLASQFVFIYFYTWRELHY